MKFQRSEILHPKTFISAWLPVVLWIIPFFYLSSVPSLHASQFFLTDFIIKKGAHVGEFVGLYALIWRATNGKIFLSIILCLIYSTIDEIHQKFVPGRTSAFFDAYGFDFVGILSSAYIIWKLKQIHRRRLKK